MKHLYRGVIFLLLALLLVLLVSSLVLGLDTIVEWGIALVGLSSKKEAILPLISRIPLAVVILAQLLPICLLIFALCKQDAIIYYLKRGLFYWKEAFVNLFKSLSTWELAAVLGLPLLASIYFGNVIAVSYDEAITYNYFTSKPFFYCMIFYPYPNNHVLHSLLTNISAYTPFVSVLFSIRLPAIVASIFTWLIAYSFLKKYYSTRVAMLVVGLASVMYLSVYYSFMSRGYAFTVLSFVVCMYAAFNIVKNGNRSKDWMFFVVSGVLGFYAIPSFLYAFATLNVFILIYNYKNIKTQIVANILAGLAVILLYSPIMLVDGIAALTSNQFVTKIDRLDILQGIFYFYRAMFADIAGVPYYVVFLIIIPLVMAIYQKDRRHMSLWLLFMLAPFVLLMIHAVNPFYRTFLYYNFIAMFLIVVPFKPYLQKVPKWTIVLFVLCIQVAGIYVFDSKIRIKEGFNTDALEVSDAYFSDKHTVVFPCIASANYEFEAKVRGLEDKILFLNNGTANVDTINNYDFVILEKGRDKTILKKPFAVSATQHIYKKED